MELMLQLGLQLELLIKTKTPHFCTRWRRWRIRLHQEKMRPLTLSHLRRILLILTVCSSLSPRKLPMALLHNIYSNLAHFGLMLSNMNWHYKILCIIPRHLLFIVISQKVLDFGWAEFTRATNIGAIKRFGVEILYIVFVGWFCYVIFRLGPHFEAIMLYFIS